MLFNFVGCMVPTARCYSTLQPQATGQWNWHKWHMLLDQPVRCLYLFMYTPKLLSLHYPKYLRVTCRTRSPTATVHLQHYLSRLALSQLVVCRSCLSLSFTLIEQTLPVHISLRLMASLTQFACKKYGALALPCEQHSRHFAAASRHGHILPAPMMRQQACCLTHSRRPSTALPRSAR